MSHLKKILKHMRRDEKIWKLSVLHVQCWLRVKDTFSNAMFPVLEIVWKHRMLLRIFHYEECFLGEVSKIFVLRGKNIPLHRRRRLQKSTSLYQRFLIEKSHLSQQNQLIWTLKFSSFIQILFRREKSVVNGSELKPWEKFCMKISHHSQEHIALAECFVLLILFSLIFVCQRAIKHETFSYFRQRAHFFVLSHERLGIVLLIVVFVVVLFFPTFFIVVLLCCSFFLHLHSLFLSVVLCCRHSTQKK